MTDINFTGFLTDPRNGRLSADAQADWPSGLVVDYRFSNGDQWVDKNGFSWASPTRSFATEDSERGVIYNYVGGNDPFGEGTLGDEEDFQMTELGEFYFKRRIFIPSNYRHRELLRVTIGNATNWQVGDSVYGSTAASTAIIEYKSGNQLSLRNAANYNIPGVWNGSITNVTRTLSDTISFTQIWPCNNKFQVFYCDGYSSLGDSPTLTCSLWPNRYSDAVWGNGSSIGIMSGVNNGGDRVVTQSPTVPFILPEHYGKWMDVIFYTKMSSAVGVTDGMFIVWRRVDGESNYTKVLDCRTLEAAERPTKGKYRRGYIWGWANSGYEQATRFVEADTMLSTTAIDGVTF